MLTLVDRGADLLFGAGRIAAMWRRDLLKELLVQHRHGGSLRPRSSQRGW